MMFVRNSNTGEMIMLQFFPKSYIAETLQWRHNEHDGISNHQPHDCLLNSLFKRRSKKLSKLRVPGPCEGNSPVTGEFPAKRASNAKNGSIWWRHHENICSCHDKTAVMPRAEFGEQIWFMMENPRWNGYKTTVHTEHTSNTSSKL